MPLAALLLVVLAALIHASWNLLAKRAGGGIARTWLLSVVAALTCLPFVLAVIALVDRRWGFLLLEGVWSIVSAASLVNVLRGRARPDDGTSPATR